MKVAIIGAKGMLGSELCRVIGSHHDIVALDIDEIDITDQSSTLELITLEKPNLVINTAAIVNMDTCEGQPEKAWAVNAEGAKNVALAAQEVGSSLVLISTDYIFDGITEKDYDEHAQPNPVNQYGRTKLAGEKHCLECCSRTYVIRTAWLFGHYQNNYVQRVLDAANKEGVVRMPDDQLESPTYTVHLAESLLPLMKTNRFGVYHVTSRDSCTRAGFATYVLGQVGRKETVEILSPQELNRPVNRPSRVVLDCRRYQDVSGHALPLWQEGVTAYLSRENLLARTG